MIDIRNATPDDLPDLFAMVCALSEFHGDAATITQAQLHNAFFAPHPMAKALIATQGGSPIGYAGLTSTMVLHIGQVRIDIHHLFVKETHRKQGIATALIARATAYAKSQNAERLTIGTDPDNAVSIAAYRAMPNLTEISGTGPRFWVDLDT